MPGSNGTPGSQLQGREQGLRRHDRRDRAIVSGLGSWPTFPVLQFRHLPEPNRQERPGTEHLLRSKTKVRERRLDDVDHRVRLGLGERDRATALYPGPAFHRSTGLERCRDAEDPVDRRVEIPIRESREASKLAGERLPPDRSSRRVSSLTPPSRNRSTIGHSAGPWLPAVQASQARSAVTTAASAAGARRHRRIPSAIDQYRDLAAEVLPARQSDLDKDWFDLPSRSHGSRSARRR